MADADSPRRRDLAAREEVQAEAGSEPSAGTDESLGDFDLGALFDVAAQLQSELTDTTEEATDAETEGVAGGGAVRITVTGSGEFRSVHIDPSAVDPDDVDLLQDLVLAALHDATRRMAELRTRQLGALGGELGDLLGSLGGQGDLGSLGDLFSGGGLGQLLGAEAEADVDKDEGDEDRGDEPRDDPPTHQRG